MNSFLIIGASLSEPHSSEYYGDFVQVCVRVCRALHACANQVDVVFGTS